MFNYLKNLKYNIKKIEYVSVKLDSLKEGINIIEDYIIIKSDQISIYDRICDHMGGKIISKDDKHVCPMHNWMFNPLNGTYSNGIKKKKTNFILENKLIKIKKKKSTQELLILKKIQI